MTGRIPSLDDLALFVDVARAGSISSAAGLHGLTQPSVSRRMSALERRLGVPLLVRTRRGTSLTANGQVVVDWAESLLAEASDFSRSVETLRRRRAVALRVAVSMTIAEYLAPTWLATLHARHPELQVALAVHNSAEVVEQVESGKADVGFVETPKVRGRLRRRRIGEDRLVVAVDPSHAWASSRTPISADELAATYLLVREPGSGTRETLEHALRGRGLELADGMVLGSNAALRSAALAGMGPVVLSELALGADLAAGRLIEVGVAELPLARPLTAVWRQDQPPPPSVATLMKIVLGS